MIKHKMIQKPVPAACLLSESYPAGWNRHDGLGPDRG